MDPITDINSIEQMLVDRASLHRRPIGCTLELTPLCNFDCRMCYVRLSAGQIQQPQPPGHLRTAAEWLHLAEQMQSSGTLFLTLTGGEPLLHPEFREIYCGLLAMGMIVSVNTNGSLIDESWADFFAANRPRRINITLYGKDDRTYERLCRVSGQYDRVVRGICMLRERGVAVKMNVSLTRENENQLEELETIAASLKVPIDIDCYMCPAVRERGKHYDFDVRLSPEDAADRQFEILIRKLEALPNATPETTAAYLQGMLSRVQPHDPTPDHRYPLRCRAGASSCAISWHGRMRPCVMMSAPEADAFAVGFEQAWQQLTAAVAALNTSEECGTCECRDLCQTCAASALCEEGACEAVPRYMCRFTRRYVLRVRTSGTFLPAVKIADAGDGSPRC